MIEATNLKSGTTFISDGKPYKVVKYTHTKMGRGGAVVRVNARNLENGAMEEKTFSSNNKVDEIFTQKRALQFLYKDKVTAFFMDPINYDQVEIPISIIVEEIPFMKEGNTVNVLFWDERPMSVEIPPKVAMSVIDTPPGVKGNSASNIYKLAGLENGLQAKVPLFINNGDKIIVDTRTGEYVERAK